MPLNREEKTKDFIKRAQTLIESGVIKNQKELGEKLDMGKAMLSNVMNGRAQIPLDKYRKFNEVYTPVNISNPEQVSIEMQMQILAYLKALTPLTVAILSHLRNGDAAKLTKDVEQQIDEHLKVLLGLSEQD